MITAKDCFPAVAIGQHKGKLGKGWGERWTLALRGKTHSVWFTQEAIDWNEKHSECDEATQEDWAIHYLDCFLGEEDRDALGTEVLVLENGLTPAAYDSLAMTRHKQASEAIDKDNQRKRAGMF